MMKKRSIIPDLNKSPAKTKANNVTELKCYSCLLEAIFSTRLIHIW